MFKFTFSVILITIAVCSYLIRFFEFILIGIFAMACIALIIIGIFRLFGRFKFIYLKILLITVLFCFIGVIVSLFRPYDAAILKYGSVSEKLKYAYKTDQNDRKQLKSFVPYFRDLQKRDHIRLNLVKSIDQDSIVKPIDRFYAAFIYHHSDNSVDFKKASTLAAKAAKSKILKNHYQAQWLKKASYDRYMISIGKPEKYHTQDGFSIEVE